jgi:hypothetical protein
MLNLYVWTNSHAVVKGFYYEVKWSMVLISVMVQWFPSCRGACHLYYSAICALWTLTISFFIALQLSESEGIFSKKKKKSFPNWILIAFPAFSLSTLSNNWYLFKYEFLLLPLLLSVIACGFYGGIFPLILGVTLSEVCYCWEYVFLFFLFWKYKNSFKNYRIKYIYFYISIYVFIPFAYIR